MVDIQPIAAFDLDGTLVSCQTQAMLAHHLSYRRMLPASTLAAVAIIVSAAPEPLVSRIAAAIGAAGFVATRLEKDAGSYTGRFDGPIIEGSHKMGALSDWAAHRYENWTLKAAFSDHASDAPLLQAAQEACAVCPDRRLRALAESEGWNILDWAEPLSAGKGGARVRFGSRLKRDR